MKERIIMDPAVPPKHCTVEQIEAAVKKVTDEANAKDPGRAERLAAFPKLKLSHEDHYRGWVTGFLFSEDLKHVVMVRKTHPENQVGKFNGVGGKIEPGESHRAAMWREFKEEAGYDYDDWQYLKPFETEKKNHYVHVFYGISDVSKCQTKTDEEVLCLNVKMILNGSFETTLFSGVADLVEECLENIHKLTLNIK